MTGDINSNTWGNLADGTMFKVVYCRFGEQSKIFQDFRLVSEYDLARLMLKVGLTAWYDSSQGMRMPSFQWSDGGPVGFMGSCPRDDSLHK